MEINGKPNVVTFRITARVLLPQFYNQQRPYSEEEKIRLIQTGEKRIRDDNKAVQIKTHDMYPSWMWGSSLKRDWRLPHDITICDAAIGLDQLLVGHCRLSHDFLLHGTVSVLSQPWICRWRDRQMSPDVLSHIVSCILDEFVGNVRYVSSVGAGRIYLNEVWPTSSHGQHGTRNGDALPSPAAVVPTWPLAWLPASSIIPLKPPSVQFSSQQTVL